MTKKKNTDDANTKTSAEATKAVADVRLKPIIPIIETQLMPVKEVLADFAKAMLDSTTELKRRTTSLEKYSTTTIGDPTTNEPHPPNQNPSFTPRSARINIDLKYSSTLANDTGIKGLKERLELCKKTFKDEVTDIFKTCAEIEATNAKETRIKTFLTYIVQIADFLIIFEKLETPLVTELNELQLSVWTTLIFLRRVKVIEP
jgi:hypothetical protein